MKKFVFISILLIISSFFTSVYASTVFLLDGTVIRNHLLDVNKIRLDFKDRKSVNAKHVWFINFINSNWNYPEDRKQWVDYCNTIILKNGDVIYKNVVDYDWKQKKRVYLENKTYIPLSKVARVYFPNTKMPKAFAKKSHKVTQLNCLVQLRKGRPFTAKLMKYSPLEKEFAFDNGYTISLTNISFLRFAKDKPLHLRKNYRIPKNVEVIILNNGHLATADFKNFNTKKQCFEFKKHPSLFTSEINRIYFRSNNNIKKQNKLIRKVRQKDY